MGSNNNVGNAQKRVLNQVSIRIDNELRRSPPIAPKISIFKVHNQLRMVNQKAYEPVCVAIGPYYYNDQRLHGMKEKKWHYLQQMLGRRQETSVERYVQALGLIEVEVHQQYAESVTLPPGEFIQMMLLDGFFIVEYFRQFERKALGDEKDTFLDDSWIYHSIRRDLLLLENQLPFKVLTTLYDLTRDDGPRNFVDLAWKFCTGRDDLSPKINDPKHLLDLVYQGMIPKISQGPQINDSTMRNKNKVKFISSATELKGSGIKFKPIFKKDLLDIQFNNGTLEIPTLKIQDHTEAFFRNLVAYEQHCQGRKINYVSDYVTFMDCLVNTPEDVELLRRKGIIRNYLGDDEVVSTMLNDMGKYITLSNFYYKTIFDEVNKKCGKRRNRWMAMLRRDYFHSPWALISVLAAIFLLLLTLLQTIYTISSYYQKN